MALHPRDLSRLARDARAGAGDEQIAKYTDRNMYLTAAQAVEVGLIDGVREPRLH